MTKEDDIEKQSENLTLPTTAVIQKNFDKETKE